MKTYQRPAVTPLGTVHQLTLAKEGSDFDGSGKPFKKEVGPGS